MLPAESIVGAITRWLELLKSSALAQAWTILRTDPNYTDLTQTQYSTGLDFLKNLGLMAEGSQGLHLSQCVRLLPDHQAKQLLFERLLERESPAWLPDSDILIPDPTELPQDAAILAGLLGLSDNDAFGAIRHLQGRIDLSERSRVGLAGESALVELLEEHWPGSTTHVSQTNDGLGYDVLFCQGGKSWHLEVKTTTRRGRLVIYLSRHEHEVSVRDPNWRLVALGLDNQMRLSAIATVHHSQLLRRSPQDRYPDAQWQSARHGLTARDLQPGLSFLDPTVTGRMPADDLRRFGREPKPTFAWMP